MRHSNRIIVVAAALLFLWPVRLAAQFNVLETEHLRLIYFNKAEEYLVPHVARSFENAWRYHQNLFSYKPAEKVTMLVTDFEDFGNGGADAIPRNFISYIISPFPRTFETVYGNDRVSWVMGHEAAHLATMDNATGRDRFFRSLFWGKVSPDPAQPVSMLYTYLTTPRRYAPRWYYEGSAVFLETWMAGGLGRTLSAYYEMVFRTMVRDKGRFFDAVGLESEGTAIDFQIGANSYLYGSRFVGYLGNTYGPEKLMQWLSRVDGSKAYFSRQFKNVYGVSLDRAWADWIDWEHGFQQANLDSLRLFPGSPYRDLANRSLGSVSRSYFDAAGGKLYTAMNYPGEVPHIAAIDVKTGAYEKICEVLGADVYLVTALAFDPDSRTLFYTTDHQGWRDIMAVDIETGKTRLLMKDARVGDLAFNRKDRSLWGVRHYIGLVTLVRIPYPYTEWNQINTYPYGTELYDIDVSPDGRWLTGARSDLNGLEQLIMMDTEKLVQGDTSSTLIFDFENSSPANFVFSSDSKHLFGSSYYSGVSNIYRYDLEDKNIFIVSNNETGLFRPTPVSSDSLIAMRYTARGFVPVMIPNQPLSQVNSIQFLGNDIVANHPVVQDWKAPPPSSVNLDSVTTFSGDYDVIDNIGLLSIYPIVEGYKNTFALGLRASFADRVNLSSVDVTASYTPNNIVPADERLHMGLDFRYWGWKLSARYNIADFYDLFGPTLSSLKGYALSLEYGKNLGSEESITRSRAIDYTIQVVGYAGLERLPQYQNVSTTFEEALFLNAHLDYKSVVRPLGTLEPMKGVEAQLISENSYINDGAHPHLAGTLSLGITPFSNSSVWLRSATGFAIGKRDNPFANFYFGGYGNNWVDYKDYQRYRHYESFPGVEINEISGTNFAKVMLEWTLPPLRFRRMGIPVFYTRWARLALFSTGIVTNLDDSRLRQEVLNVGGQLDFSLVLFSSLKSYLSFGYAAAFRQDRAPSTEFMISLKIL